MPVTVTIVYDRTEVTSLVFESLPVSILVSDLKRRILEQVNAPAPVQAVRLFQESVELHDDHIVHEDGLMLELTLYVMKPHVKYVINASKARGARGVYFFQGALPLRKLLNFIQVENSHMLAPEDLPLSISKDIENREPFSPSHRFEPDGTTVYVSGLADTTRPPRVEIDDTPCGPNYTLQTFEFDMEKVLAATNTTIFAESPSGQSGESSLLKIQPPRFIDSIYDRDWILWSKEVMDGIRTICDLVTPVDVIMRQYDKRPEIVLLGVSGCGKSRTCYDYCRSRYSIYLDWSHHVDLRRFRAALESVPRPCNFLDVGEVRKFEMRIKTMTMRLLLCRWIVWEVCNKSESFNADRFFQIQQLARSGMYDIFEDAFFRLANIGDREICVSFERMREWCKAERVRVVLDEVHILLETLPRAFHSSQSAEVNNMNQYVYPRSYFSFLANFLREYGFETLWAGSHLRIGHVSKISSKSAPERPLVFTEFNFLSSEMIQKLLTEWVKIDDENLKVRIANELQGRPRIFLHFIFFLSRRELRQDSWDMKTIFEEFVAEAVRVYQERWEASAGQLLNEFAGDPEAPPRVDSVLTLLEDLLFNFYLADFNKPSFDPHWYKSLVSTGLVMIGGDTASICEPLIIRAGFQYIRTKTRNDIPTRTVIQRFIQMEVDESTRGKAIESICVIRLRDCFWKDERFWCYFPASLVGKIKARGIPAPLWLDDCRTGDPDHLEKLRNSFLSETAQNVVRPQSYRGCADVVYGHFTFHVKSTWTCAAGGDITVAKLESEKNFKSIDKTWMGDEIMTMRVVEERVPWVRVLFEFPTNREMTRQDVPEIITREGDYCVTITAGIDARFTELFFGREFVELVKKMTNGYD